MQRGYIGLLGLVVSLGVIGVFIYVAYLAPAGSGTATSTPTKVGQSSIETDIRAREDAKAIQDMSAQRAADMNAQMEDY